MTSEHHGKTNGGSNQWLIKVKITPQLSKIHPPFSLRLAEFRQVMRKLSEGWLPPPHGALMLARSWCSVLRHNWWNTSIWSDCFAIREKMSASRIWIEDLFLDKTALLLWHSAWPIALHHPKCLPNYHFFIFHSYYQPCAGKNDFVMTMVIEDLCCCNGFVMGTGSCLPMLECETELKRHCSKPRSWTINSFR